MVGDDDEQLVWYACVMKAYSACLQQTDDDKYKFSHWRYDVGHKSFVPPVPGDEHIVRDAKPASLYPG